MGDRGNIRIDYERGGQIYLYTHWGGSEIGETLKRALIRGRDRWNDESYLARIIFCELVDGQEKENTGYGIAPYPPDNGHDILCVDCKTQEVVQLSRSGRAELSRMSFDDYTKD